MTHPTPSFDELRAIFDAERPHHPEWSVSHFGLMLSPLCMALLELYHRQPASRRSRRLPPSAAPPPRPPDYRPAPRPSKFYGLDQKRLASGEKPDDD